MRKSGWIIVVAAAAACGGEQPSAPAASSSSVVISGVEQYAPPLTTGLRIQLTATITTGAASQNCTATATWKSADEGVLRPAGQPGEFLAVANGTSNVSATCNGSMGQLALRIERLGTFVTGRILAAPDGPPIADATITVGDSTVRSGANGTYTILSDDASDRPMTVSAAGFQTRQTALRGGDRRTLDITLIGNDPAFPFSLYRMITRNGFESPNFIHTAPLQVWTAPPNVYIWTTWKDSGLPVNNVEWYVTEIRRVIPVLTGGRFEAGQIEYGPAQRSQTPGWINMQFERSGNWSYVGANPGQLQLGSDHTCNQYAVIHEFGHAMGYWHSNQRPSVMGGGPGACALIPLSAEEQLIAKTMYLRPRGNLDPDRDPASYTSLMPSDPPPVRVTCDRLLK
jgi:hypothetical protein